MKSILLIGMGRFGRYTARKLMEFGHDVMAVDKKEKRINKIMDSVTSVRIGNAANKEFLSTLESGTLTSVSSVSATRFWNHWKLRPI